MDVNAKIGIDSKRTTAASVAIVGVVVYLALVHLKPILMPLAMAVLLYFLIKPMAVNMPIYTVQHEICINNLNILSS